MRTKNYKELRTKVKSCLDVYNSIKETEYIMKSPALMEIIRKGDGEIKANGGKVVNIDELWKNQR